MSHRGTRTPRRKLSAVLRELEAVRARFGDDATGRGGAAERKVALIRESFTADRRGGTARIRGKRLRLLHDTLLFLAAHPDDENVLRAARIGLRDFPRLVGRPEARELGNSGIAGTETIYPFDYPNAKWLSDNFPRETSIDWSGFDKDEELEALLPTLSGPSEETGLEGDETTTRGWLDRVRGRRSDLSWFIERIARLDAEARLKERLYDDLGLAVKWRHADPRGAQTGNILEEKIAGPAFLHAEPLVRKAPALADWVRRPLPDPAPCPPKVARRLMNVARAALSTREREMYPITHTNMKQVYLHRLEHGLSIMICAAREDRLLYPESLWGFLGLKNGVPIGYGCFSVLFGSADIAFNVFEAFRQGESGLFYAQLLRVIHRHAGVEIFCVDTSQFGEDSEEAIQSGAFWFYHKLGFKPFDPRMTRDVAKEVAKIARRPGYRSSPETLRRITHSNIFLHIAAGESRDRDILGNIPIERLGLAVTGMIGREHGGDREAAIRSARGSIEAATGARMPAGEVAGEMCLLFAAAGDFTTWSGAERKALGGIIRARGEGDERGYVRMLERHGRARELLKRALRRKSR